MHKGDIVKPEITIVDKSKIRIEEFVHDTLGKVEQETIDLAPHTQHTHKPQPSPSGQALRTLRLWLNHDGTYSLDPKKDHYWQVAEIDVPEAKYQQIDTGEVDEDGNPVMVSVAILDFTEIEIKKWELPA